MLALKGIYENGKVILEDKPPIEVSEVVVVFPDNKSVTTPEGLTPDKKREMFDSFTGSINRVIDFREERFGALDEKY